MERLPRRFGRYVLLRQLGQGGMGAVYLARPIERDAGLPTPVVIKVLTADLGEDDLFVRRFRHEAELATHVDSPHVVKVYDAGRVDDRLYIAMEHVAGWSLSRVMGETQKAQEQFALPWARTLVAGVLEGLAALHGARDANGAALGIVHRDVSPKNVMIGEGLNVFLIDLGIGRSSVQDWKTRTGVVLGTPGYMSPEQVMGKALDHRTDLYAAGIVLFELLTLTRFIPRAASTVETLRASVAPKLRPPSSIRPGVPVALDRVVARALAASPDQRFQSAEDFRDALFAALPPKPGDRAELARIEEALAHELGEPQTEVKALALHAAEAEADDDDEPEPQRTEIYAERPGVRPFVPSRGRAAIERATVVRDVDGAAERRMGPQGAAGTELRARGLGAAGPGAQGVGAGGAGATGVAASQLGAGGARLGAAGVHPGATPSGAPGWPRAGHPGSSGEWQPHTPNSAGSMRVPQTKRSAAWPVALAAIALLLVAGVVARYALDAGGGETTLVLPASSAPPAATALPRAEPGAAQTGPTAAPREEREVKGAAEAKTAAEVKSAGEAKTAGETKTAGDVKTTGEVKTAAEAKTAGGHASDDASTAAARTSEGRAARVKAGGSAEPEPATLPDLETWVDQLVGRTQALRRRVPAEAPKRAAVDALLAELLQLRASPRLSSERPEAERLAKELAALEKSPD